ncbi:flagellar assembly peptidoglycan hydrolase FlgJ [Aestuariicella sp. G3-2]|uniref:flagellar assembly peptidoglycan hydrolase FlgJ n=1 Tax=Pseudomaricurvus albidus TaxID=2842452 RepID=UPI001C0B9DF0|nr:flagellar assembly peptidoglycan hydrolase FlgJ [Aestuariicella albida]MBU3071156.1 flagellar assembly peptidoglycan hydrolase FlgJ [Aestuariicella albida]
MSLDQYSAMPPGLGTDASVYTDLTGLQKIKQLNKGSTEDRDQALEQVAQQFESVFLGMMMKSMRDANKAFEDDEMSGSSEMKFYQQMFDQQLTLSLSNKGVGIAEAMVRQLKQGVSTSEIPSVTSPVTDGSDMNNYFKNVIEKVVSSVVDDAGQSPVTSTPTSDQKTLRNSEESLTLETFKEHLLPLARKAAKALGVDAGVILSQAALETGWGRHMIKDQDGRNSYNLFGIKADSGWQGDTAVVSTLEYRDGIPAQEKASFRSYNSYEESFRDYVSFIQSHSRYQDALKSGADASKYLNGLQQAGYATDPKYADKIMGIVEQHFPKQLADRG